MTATIIACIISGIAIAWIVTAGLIEVVRTAIVLIDPLRRRARTLEDELDALIEQQHRHHDV